MFKLLTRKLTPDEELYSTLLITLLVLATIKWFPYVPAILGFGATMIYSWIKVLILFLKGKYNND